MITIYNKYHPELSKTIDPYNYPDKDIIRMIAVYTTSGIHAIDFLTDIRVEVSHNKYITYRRTK